MAPTFRMWPAASCKWRVGWVTAGSPREAVVLAGSISKTRQAEERDRDCDCATETGTRINFQTPRRPTTARERENNTSIQGPIIDTVSTYVHTYLYHPSRLNTCTNKHPRSNKTPWSPALGLLCVCPSLCLSDRNSRWPAWAVDRIRGIRHCRRRAPASPYRPASHATKARLRGVAALTSRLSKEESSSQRRSARLDEEM
jgi:hypothetical protein